MAVLLAARQLGVRTRGMPVLDAYGDETTGPPGELRGPWPGRAQPHTDGTWLLAVDPRAGLLLAGDIVAEPATGAEWTVLAADELRNAVDPALTYVRVTARPRVAGGTRPEGHR
ncbi:hypothetical protein [Streptomyces sp. CB01881]|uniref:hypothetical protein n=1 Tax=Streptomyces sp. CB01881 TaxID=2078691 RepID=UPI000CDBCCD9|nr:hypothetical protein [Streptomyces sp. CB01881]AUY50461.1 hypothetical protein C2142_17670 [Streptomyces sp. CB01881]TYC73848.1 hypothetical protein EH183_17650 [Streptomyces sp. CB01881]